MVERIFSISLGFLGLFLKCSSSIGGLMHSSVLNSAQSTFSLSAKHQPTIFYIQITEKRTYTHIHSNIVIPLWIKSGTALILTIKCEWNKEIKKGGQAVKRGCIVDYKTTHFFFFSFFSLVTKDALVAVSKTSLTPSPVLAEHSK